MTNQPQTLQAPDALVASIYNRLADGDIDGVVACLDENVHWTEAEGFPTGGTYRGPEEVRSGVFGPIGEIWADFTCTPTQILACGDQVVSLGIYSGTCIESGNPMEVPFCHIWTVRDGEVSAFQQFTDTLLVHNALNG